MSQAPDSPNLPRKPRVFVVVLLCLGFTLAIGLLVHHLGNKAAAPASLEFARKDLVLRDGLLYRAGEKLPFTGAVTNAYGGGELKSRSLVSNGLPEGLSEGWFTNGHRQVEEYFHAGVSYGLRTKWYDDGKKLSEVHVVDGKLQGTFRHWHPDGTLAEEAELKDGQPDGLSRSYYPSGFVKVEARLRAGKMIEQQSWQDGEHVPTTVGTYAPLTASQD